LRGNATIEVVVQAPTITRTHLQLYNAYHADMHQRRGWPWHPTDPMAYFQSYLGGDWAFAREFLYYEQGRLVGAGARGLFDLAAARLRAAAWAAVSLSGVLDRGLSLHGV